MAARLCLIGLDPALAQVLREAHFGPVIVHDTVPKFLVRQGMLYIERHNGVGMLPVDRVVFHGIYEDDFDFITALAIWGGPCFPNALGMMNCRLKLPCLARALRISHFNSPRGMVAANTPVQATGPTVAKWGNWHCGENKAKFDGRWIGEEAAIIEPFFAGESVRVVSVGEVHLQIRLAGADWLKSIHADNAAFMPLDPELLEDTLRLKAAFGLEMIANDYIVSTESKHLLEVNHIPNMTRFKELRTAYLKTVRAWLDSRRAGV